MPPSTRSKKLATKEASPKPKATKTKRPVASVTARIGSLSVLKKKSSVSSAGGASPAHSVGLVGDEESKQGLTQAQLDRFLVHIEKEKDAIFKDLLHACPSVYRPFALCIKAIKTNSST
jgi:hypothetical protein